MSGKNKVVLPTRLLVFQPRKSLCLMDLDNRGIIYKILEEVE